MTKILICGYGSIGKKHAQNLKTLGVDVSVWRNRPEASAEIKDDGFAFEPDLDKGLKWCDGVVVATSTDSHIFPASKAAKLGKAIYLEKPVSHNLDGLDELLEISKGLVVEVGCQLRQYPNFKALKECLDSGKDGKILAFQAWVGQRLDQWRPGTDYRECYSADASRGGGALFDLVHEVDLMTWLVGPMESVYADLRQNSDLEMKAEDLANLILVSCEGAAGTVQLDMLSPAYRRGLQVVCDRAVYRCDMQEGVLWRSEGAGLPEKVSATPKKYAPPQMLYDAMANFIARVKKPDLPANCSLEEGVHDLKILLSAREASASGTRQMLES